MFFACGIHKCLLRGLVVTALAVVLASGCGGGGGSNEEQAQSDTATTGDEDRHLDLNIGTAEEEDDASQDFTPVVAEVPQAPIPFAGSDGRTHLVYELKTTNFSNGETTIEQLEVLDPDTGDVVDTLDTEEVASRLQPAGLREPADALAASMTANVFLDLTFDEAGEVPDRLVHRLSVKADAAPPDQQQSTEEVAPTEVDRRNAVVVGPPLKGSNYVAADSCCSALHRQASLPINGKIWLAQRYAVDYEQLDADDRIYSGEKEVDNYTIYGQEAIAVADGTVVKVIDGVPEQEPGVFPRASAPTRPTATR